MKSLRLYNFETIRILKKPFHRGFIERLGGEIEARGGDTVLAFFVFPDLLHGYAHSSGEGGNGDVDCLTAQL